jgi:hypothetical protein
MVRKDIHRAVRQSLGLPPKAEPTPTLPQEGHVSEFPLWSFSKKRSTMKERRITYEDGSYVHIDAPKGFPSVTAPGYLDVLMYFGQRDLFTQNWVEMSAYRILHRLQQPPEGSSYQQFTRDMERNFALSIKTDRFLHPVTQERTHVLYFRIFEYMLLAKRGKGESRFYFNAFFSTASDPAISRG